MMGILPRVNLRVKVDQGSIKGSLTKAPLVLQGLTKIGYLTLSHKEVIVVVLMLIGLIMQNVVKSMVVSA